MGRGLATALLLMVVPTSTVAQPTSVDAVNSSPPSPPLLSPPPPVAAAVRPGKPECPCLDATDELVQARRNSTAGCLDVPFTVDGQLRCV